MTFRGHKRGVWDIAFSPIEKILASVSGDGTLKLWNLNDGSCMSTFEGHTGSVLRVGWISLGLELISGKSLKIHFISSWS
jgi:U3 small nucleolar RNA-associated protein 13